MRTNLDEFHFPVLIYDNYCLVCSRFAKFIYYVSGNKIEILGHYDSEKSKKIKDIVFSNYPKDPTNMFWIITKNGAFGSRLGLLILVRELLKIKLGIVHYDKVHKTILQETICDILLAKPLDQSISCLGCQNGFKSTINRIFYLFKNSDFVQWYE